MVGWILMITHTFGKCKRLMILLYYILKMGIIPAMNNGI